MNEARRIALCALICAGLVLFGPLVGLWIWERPFEAALQFPPMSYPKNFPRYHSWAFISWIGFVLILATLWWAARGQRRERHLGYDPVQGSAGSFPWWGWCGVAFGVAFWLLGWTRFDWFAAYQPYTFIPQWLSFILVVNGLAQRKTGQCPLTSRPSFFLKLFGASSALWWMFEYLNGFVNNWLYQDASYARNPAGYILFATIAFSTVIPGVYSTKKWLETFGGLQRFLAGGPSISLPSTGPLNAMVLFLVTAAMILVVRYPNCLYPVLWVGPVAGWLAATRLLGVSTGFGAVARGDWRDVLNWGGAALICGGFWEMWNYYSMSKWTYQIPYLHVCRVFEMPLAGYTGYLVFGLECAIAVTIVRAWSWHEVENHG